MEDCCRAESWSIDHYLADSNGISTEGCGKSR